MNIRQTLASTLFFIFILNLITPCQAYSINNQDIPDHALIDNHFYLQLNGAGIRRKAFFDIYIAALYLEHPKHTLDDIINSEMRSRLSLRFLYSEVTKEKLLEGWRDGFNLNHTPEQLELLKDRFNKSCSFFRTMHSGDTIDMDYLPGTGTRIYINQEFRGEISGHDFYQAILKVWLGKHPTQASLRNELLGPNLVTTP